MASPSTRALALLLLSGGLSAPPRAEAGRRADAVGQWWQRHPRLRDLRAPGAPRTARQRWEGLKRWIAKPGKFDRTGVVATVETQVGVGVSVIGDVGFRMTPKDLQTGKREVGVFASGEAHAFAVGVRGSVSNDPALRGVEWKYGPMGHGSPMYGDRVSVTLVPEVFSLFAGRSGGLGMRLTPFPLPQSLVGRFLPGKWALLARMGGTVYVTDPSLARTSGWVLDAGDWAAEPFRSGWAQAKAGGRRLVLGPDPILLNLSERVVAER